MLVHRTVPRLLSSMSASAPGFQFPLATALLLVALSAGTAAGEQRSIDQCVEMALANKPSLKAAGALVDAAHQRVWQAASGYLPQISSSEQIERRKSNVGLSTGTDFDIPARIFTVSTIGIGFSQVLFDFGRNLATIRAAQANERSVAADRNTERLVVIFEAKQSYFNLLASQRLLVVAQETVKQNTTLSDEAETRHQVGLAPRFDVTRARVQLANAELNQLTARNNVALARETLRNALGLSEPIDFEIVDNLDVVEVEVSESQALATAYQNRPEIQSLEQQARAVEQSITALQRDYLPALRSAGEFNWSGRDTPDQESWRVSAGVDLSLFNGGLTTTQIGEQRANLARLGYDEEDLRQRIALEVRQALLNLEQATESIAVSRAGMEQARENLEIALGRYRGGVGNIIELTDARTADTTANAAYVRALYDHQIARASLERAIGTSLPLAGEGR